MGSRRDPEGPLNQLLTAEHEGEVLAALHEHNLMSQANWVPLGGMENNFGIVSNQQEDATAALVEKIINGIDSNLTSACYARGIDPEGATAPGSMTEAVDKFFEVPKGRIGDLPPRRQADLR